MLTVAVIVVPFECIIWDGGFSNAKYRLTFVGGDGRPVPGVTLRVVTQSEGVSYLYPVNEFLPDATPTSDAEGRMVFHHIGDGMEFGGREYRNLLGMRFGETGAPQYVCVFLIAGREVHRVRYDELRPRAGRDHLPTVTQAWQDTDWPLREYRQHHREWGAHRLRLFDGNGDGNLDRGERTAAGYFERVLSRFDTDPGKREVELYVIERTLTVTTP